MDTGPQIVKKFLGFSIGPIGSAIIGFLTVPIITYFVLPEEFGKSSMYHVASQLVSMTIYLGLDRSFIREYKTDVPKNKLLWNSVTIPLALSLLILLSIIFFRKPLSILLFDYEYPKAIVLLGIAIPLTVLKRFNLIMIRMEEKALLFSLVNILDRVFTLVATLGILLLVRRDFIGIVEGSFFGLLSTVLFLFCCNYKTWKTKIQFDWYLLKKMLMYALPLVPSSLLIWGLNSIDKIALRTWSDFGQIGIYAVVFKIITAVKLMQGSFASFWWPTAFRWHESNAKTDKFTKATSITTTGMTILFFLIVLFRHMIMLLFDEKYSEGARFMPFLLFIPVMYTISETTVIGIHFSRKSVFDMYIAVLTFVIALGLNVLLVPSYGALGASIGSGIAYICFYLLRTIFSNSLGWNIPLLTHLPNVILMIALSLITVNEVSFLIELSLLLLVIALNRKNIMYITKILFSMMRNLLKKYQM